VLVYERLSSARDRRTLFASSLSSPHRAKSLNAAIVHAIGARQEAHTRGPTVLLWQTVVRLDHTVSTSLRVFQGPRGQTCRLAGAPVVAWHAVSVRTIIVWAHWAIREGKYGSGTVAGAPSQADIPPLCRLHRPLPPTIPRGLLCPIVPT